MGIEEAADGETAPDKSYGDEQQDGAQEAYQAIEGQDAEEQEMGDNEPTNVYITALNDPGIDLNSQAQQGTCRHNYLITLLFALCRGKRAGEGPRDVLSRGNRELPHDLRNV